MSRITSEKNTAEYDATDRSGVEILADGACNRNLLTIVGLGGDFSAGTVAVYIKGRGSRRYLAMKDAYGNAVSINLATADAVMIDKPIGSVRLDVSGISGATGWKAVLSGIDEPMSVASSSVPGPVIVAGQSAVGSAPANPPVGVSGIDGSGLKRALLTDSTGQLMTTEQDSAVFTASATSASVLFTVDMSSWRSCMVQVVNAGTSCTVTYEGSNDQSTWNTVVGLLANPNTATSPSSSLAITFSNAAGAFQFPKRYKYFRARVSVYGSGTVSVLYSLSLSDVSPVVAASIYGQVAEGIAFSGNPVTIGVECRITRKTAVGNGQIVRPIGTVDGKIIVRPHSIPENEWKYAAGSGGIVNTTTAVQLAAAGGAGLSVYITSMQLQAEALTNATEVAIRDGAGGTVVWRSKIGTSGLPLTQIGFEDPIKGTANTLLEFVTLTASGAGAVYINAQGYYAP